MNTPDYIIDELEIPLNQNLTTTIDSIDADLIRFKWTVSIMGVFEMYVRAFPNKSQPYMSLSRVILSRKIGRELRRGELCDHANGNTLDNRRKNLRIATCLDNSRNGRKPKTNTSGYKGVSWSNSSKKWVAQIAVGKGKVKYLGVFDDPYEAHKAYCEAAKKYHGNFARFD